MIYTILHVSDVHFGSSTRGEQESITSRLIEAAHAHVEKNFHRQPDICIFSGDLSNLGTIEQLEIGEKWLENLINPWSCETFIVPGNHDVVRPIPTKNQPNIEIRNRRSASTNQKTYDDYRGDIGNASLMQQFFIWHNKQETKARLNLASDWNESKFGCSYSCRLNNIEVVVIGVNSALLSCDDKDQGYIIIDEKNFNELINKTNPNKQLIIVVSHHPIGLEQSGKRWLAKWNAKTMEELFLQKNGPHIYLHGHLHHDKGTSVSYSTGQNLALFGAGACYDTDKNYPKRFAFYDIDLGSRTISPHIYSYNRKKGLWFLDTERSVPIQAVMPPPIGMTEQSATEKLGEFRDLIKHFVLIHLDIEKTLHESIPRLAPEFDSMLNPGVRHELLKHQYLKGYKKLIVHIDIELQNKRQGNYDIEQSLKHEQLLKDVRSKVEQENLNDAIKLLHKFPIPYPSILLTALVLSDDASNWNKAKQFLSHATPWHYLTLSYSAWSETNLDKAIDWAEKALFYYDESLTSSNNLEVPNYKIWNNLAYYYADAGKYDKRQQALEFAEKATKEVSNHRRDESEHFANFLDTWGYVEIAFAENLETLRQGLKRCETARRLGADIRLYFKHIAKAESQLPTLL